MNQAWRLYSSIWRTAVHKDGTGLRSWIVILLLASVLGVLLGVSRFAGAFNHGIPLPSVLTAISIPVNALMALWWMRYVPGAVRQNSPENARLVPGLHAAVRRTTVVAWCLSMVPLAMLASGFPNPSFVFLIASLFLTSATLSAGGRPVGMFVYAGVIFAMAAGGKSMFVATLLSQPSVLAAGVLVSFAYGWWALHAVFPAGGDKHFGLLKKQARRQAGSDLAAVQRVQHRSGARNRLYAWMLHYDLGRGSREDLLLHALGPYNHRFDLALPALAVLAAAGLMKLANSLHVFAIDRDVLLIATIMGSLCILAQGLFCERFVASMKNTAGEQSLVRLAPSAPGAPQLGATLARLMLVLCLREWAMCIAVMTAAVLLLGGGASELRVLAGFGVVSLAMAGWALRDYSGKLAQAHVEEFVQAALVGAGGVALFLVREDLPTWCLLLGLLFACACVIVSGRWQRMAGAPSPFPSGRFA